MKMAASRLLTLIGPSILRNPPRCLQAYLNLNRICLTSSPRFERYISSALTRDSGSCTLNIDASPAVTAHPWPEWVNFLDQLKVKGYLTQNGVVADHGSGGGDDSEGIVDYTEMKLVKAASLSFARERFDIFKSLSTQDIRRIVEKGCPNLLRKAVNSAKRLRAYLDLDEGDVCSFCDLRGSCDRAYVVLEDSEGVVPRTVDVVRILLLYALDPVVTLGENKPPNSGRELLESSVKKLLSQLIELSETQPDTNLPKPASIISRRVKQPNDLPVNKISRNVEMKKGDWVCTNCSFMNFASKKQCFRCQEPRPPRQLKPGDWECLDCDFVNYSRNTVCKKCNCKRPQENHKDRGTWKRPF